MDAFWQKIAKFVFNVSNLLSAQVPTLQTDKVENIQARFGSPQQDPFVDPLRPSFGPRPILWQSLP